MVGIDIDLGCLSYGAKNFDNIGFVNGTGDCLPFKDNTFDLVYSRVSLPYTNIPRALDEISRVLKKGGEVWFALHSIFITLQHLKTSILKLQLKDLIFRSYVLVDGMLLHVFGKQYAFPVNKKCESYQTEGGICKALIRAGFSDIAIDRSNGFVVTAKMIKKF